MIYVDSNVPMYLVGAPHEDKRRVLELVPQLLNAHERLVTSAETSQDVVHRYTALKDRRHLDAAYEALEVLVVQTESVLKLDVDETRSLSGRYPTLSSRDCLHVAIMKRIGSKKIWSYDGGFDVVPGLSRIS